MKETQKIIVAFLTGAFVISFFFVSCKKKKENPPEAIITVVDSATLKPVAGDTVRLHQDYLYSKVNGNQAAPPDPDRKTTDARGEVKFTLKYEATFWAEVTSALKPGKKDSVLVRFQKNLEFLIF